MTLDGILPKKFGMGSYVAQTKAVHGKLQWTATCPATTLVV